MKKMFLKILSITIILSLMPYGVMAQASETAYVKESPNVMGELTLTDTENKLSDFSWDLISFEMYNENGQILESGSIIEKEACITIKADISTVSENSDLPVLLYAVYTEDGSLDGIQISTKESVTTANGITTYEMTLNNLERGKTYKAFLWNGFDKTPSILPGSEATVNPVFIDIDGLYTSDAERIKTPDELTASSTIGLNLRYDNKSKDKFINCCLSYYDAKGTLINETFEDAKIPGYKESQMQVNFKTLVNLKNISAVKISVIDSLTGKEACERYFISDYDWTASGVLDDRSAYNLVTTFFGDEGTTRAFAWTADKEHSDMAIRYAHENDKWYEESIIKDAVYTAYNGRLHYKVDIDNLMPGETYVYKIGDKRDDLWSDAYSFQTEPDNLTDFSFLCVTDPQSDSWDSGFNIYKDTLDAAFIAEPDIDFMINLGDMINLGYKYDEWDAYFDAVKGIAESIPHMALVGNHETRGDANTAVKYFTLFFNNPQNGEGAFGALTADDVGLHGKGVVNNSSGTVYSFDYGNTHFSVLNTGTDYSEKSTITIMTEQAKWLKNDLNASNKKWKIVLIHQAMYPAKTERYDTRDQLLEVIDECGVDLVLQGHDHMVSRTYPMYNDKIVTTDNPDSVTKGIGTVYAIMGAAGPKRYAELTEVPSYMASLKTTDSKQPTYSLFDINDEKISIITRQLDGTVIDSFEIVDKN